MNLDVLTLAPQTRSEVPPRPLDFVVNGQTLRELARIAVAGFGVFGWQLSSSERMHARELLLLEPSRLASGRVALYICERCTSLGCGAVTARVTAYDDRFVWSELASENDYDADLVERYAEGRDLHFERAAYEQVIGRYA